MRAHRNLLILFLLAIFVAGCVGQSRPVQYTSEKRAEKHAELGASYMQRNRIDIALEELELALSINPDNSLANYVMATLQSRLRNYDKADSHFRRAIRTKKDYAQAQHGYGVLLCNQGRPREALKLFNKALKNPLYRTPELTHFYTGNCLLDQSKPDLPEAERHLRAALAVNPKMPAALYLMARIRHVTGSHLSARGYIERYFEVGRDTPRTLLLAVKVERALGAKDIEASYAARLRMNFPKSKEARDLEHLTGK